MAPPRLTTQSSHPHTRLNQSLSGHIAKASKQRELLSLSISKDSLYSDEQRPAYRLLNSDGGAAWEPLPRLPTPVRTPPAMPHTGPVGAPIERNDESGWHEALRAVNFDVNRLAWLPEDYLNCFAVCFSAANHHEQENDLLAARNNYAVVRMLARHAALNIFPYGTSQYDICSNMQELANEGMDRCAEVLKIPVQVRMLGPEITSRSASEPCPKVVEQAPEMDPTDAALARMPTHVRSLVVRELERLRNAQEGSEAEMARRYVDWCVALPWNQLHPNAIDVQEARRILDAEHQGLEKVKARILEEISVQKRLGKPTGRVICLVGPSGVGKTSVVKSIAHALGKKLLRQALGGVSDEMEIRGNNRAYTGAQPGRVVQAMCDAGYSDPVFLLDEIDKIVRQTHRGDPSAALLEMLDPEQNHAFKDAYLGFGYDLSQVTFIATANYVDDIPVALSDRLEIIKLSGYTPLEKQTIGRTHLIPKQMANNKLDDSHLTISDAGLAYVIKYYTQEPGVRELEKQIAAVCRKVVTRLEAGEQVEPVNIVPDNVASWLGPQRYRETTRLRQEAPGVVNGLAWTQAGGVILPVEARAHKRAARDGRGQLVLTGNVRKVMEESASIALNFLRTTYPAISDALATNDLYLHLPAGAVEKDGPSGGVTLVTAMTAALSKHAVPDDVAMTGEIGLFGEVWPVGGIKEKSLAAYGAGCKRLFLPKANQIDLEDVPEEVKNNVDIVLVEHCSELLHAIFGPVAALATEAGHVAQQTPTVTDISVRDKPCKVDGVR